MPSLVFLSFISGRQMGRNVQIHPSGRRGGGISNSGTVIGLLVINKAGVGKFRQGTPVPSTDLLKRKFLPPLLFFFKRVRPSVGRRALKGVNLSLMVTRSVPAVEKQQTSERVERRVATSFDASRLRRLKNNGNKTQES